MKKIVSVFLAIMLLLSLISCGQERTWSRDAEASKDRENTDSSGAEESTKKAESLPEETLTSEPEAAILPLQAEDLTWIVEPTYDYDDVEPIWARDFSDYDGVFLEPKDVTDGQKFLLESNGIWGNTFKEMSFPTYSCLDEYYYTSKENERTLFYMPDQIDSGNYAPDENGNNRPPIVINGGGILAEHNNFEPWQYWGDGVWSVLYYTTYVVASARLVWAVAEDEAYFVWSYSGPGYYLPMSELCAPLHKPYPAQQAELSPIDPDNPNAYRYASSLDPHYGFVDPEGNLITDFVYDATGTFSDGLCAVCQDEKWGFIDETGDVVIEPQFEAVWKDQNLAYPCTSDTIVVSKDGKLGVLYRDGTLLVDYGQFEDLAPAWNNELWAKQDGKWGLIDLAAAKRSAGLSEGEVSGPSGPSAIDMLPSEKPNEVDGTVVASGNCGIEGGEDSVKWLLDSNGTLTIAGLGEMGSFSEPPYAPWYGHREEINKVVILEGVTSIGNHAFTQCLLINSVSIPDSVTSIGVSAFSACHELASVTIPDGVTSIGYAAFRGCSSLKNVTIPDTVRSLGEAVFDNCLSLTSVQISNQVTIIGRYMFYDCASLTSVTIPDSVTAIGEKAFCGCLSLTRLTIPNSVVTIDTTAFASRNSHLTIICTPGSEAEEHAKQHELLYSYL